MVTLSKRRLRLEESKTDMLLPGFSSAEGKTFISKCLSASSSFHKEISIKLTPHQVVDKRVLFGFDKTDKPAEEWFQFIKGFNTPPEALQRFFQLSSDANAFLFGIEETSSQTTLKIYLEYWEQLIDLIHKGQHQKQAFALNRGFKWSTDDPQTWVEDIYWCYPMLSNQKIKKMLNRLLATHAPLLEQFMMSTLLNRREISGDMLVYLEIASDEHKRRSFDINCYKANLHLHQIQAPLLQLAEQWLIKDQVTAALAQSGQLALGHISGGVDRNNTPFLTLYLEA